MEAKDCPSRTENAVKHACANGDRSCPSLQSRLGNPPSATVPTCKEFAKLWPTGRTSCRKFYPFSIFTSLTSSVQRATGGPTLGAMTVKERARGAGLKLSTAPVRKTPNPRGGGGGGGGGFARRILVNCAPLTGVGTELLRSYNDDCHFVPRTIRHCTSLQQLSSNTGETSKFKPSRDSKVQPSWQPADVALR